MALGAQPAHVAKLIARQTFPMAVIGITAGLAAALVTGSAIRSLLYGISLQDSGELIFHPLLPNRTYWLTSNHLLAENQSGLLYAQN